MMETARDDRRVALITGCGLRTGVGATTARTLARSGVSVMVADISTAGAGGADEDGWRGLESLVQEIREAGGVAESAVGDITNPADADRLAKEAYDRLGSLDILVNNASAPQAGAMVDIEELEPEQWERVMAVNATGTFLMSKAAVKYMRKRGWGRIISIASMCADLGGAKHVVFSASKAAVVGFTRALADDVGPEGITAMAINPMIIMTSRGEAAVKRMYGDGENAAAHIPVRRFSTPQDIANVVQFLSSEEASYMSGEVINVTGGTLQLNMR